MGSAPPPGTPLQEISLPDAVVLDHIAKLSLTQRTNSTAHTHILEVKRKSSLEINSNLPWMYIKQISQFRVPNYPYNIQKSLSRQG